MQPLNIALIQTPTCWHDPVANRSMFDAWFAKLPEPCQLVVLPEMFTTGFTMASADVAETMAGDTPEWLRQTARELGKTLCGSVVIREDARFYNRFLWVPPSGEIAVYDKRHRFRMADEHEHYSAGRSREIMNVAEWRICPMVCYDLRFPVWFRNRQDYDALVCVANWPAARQQAWNALLRARAIENQAFAIGCNRVGTDGNGIEYTGGSAAYGPDGRVIAESFGEAKLISVELSGDELVQLRRDFPVWQDADEFEIKE